MAARNSSPGVEAPPVLSRELLLYGLFSGLALAVDTGLYLLSLHLGASWPVAACLGFALGLLVTYTGSTGVVFRQRRLQNRQAEFAIFGLIGAAGLVLTQLSLWLWLATLHLPPLAAKLLTALGVFGFNFSLRKTLLFSRSPVRGSHA